MYYYIQSEDTDEGLPERERIYDEGPRKASRPASCHRRKKNVVRHYLEGYHSKPSSVM